ncbi:MAG: hypothetical protein Q9M48_02810 [Rhodobacterales bacterium]|nr:hypothetical protein [Rhodobacterales bacterium]
MTKKFAHVVYKITFPNGKIYVGKDVGTDGHSIAYFGSWNTKLVENDFSKNELKDFAIRREILFEHVDVKVVSQAEIVLIVELGANNPEIGYNRRPKFKG